MYLLVLILHSWWRWAVLALLLVTALRAVVSVIGRRPWTGADQRFNMLATHSLDVQMVLGLLLYLFLSPVTTGAFSDVGAAMRTSSVRFWVVEHPAMMIVALVLAHIGSVRARKGASDSARHRRTAIFFGLVLLLVLMATPWPGMANARPLLRIPF